MTQAAPTALGSRTEFHLIDGQQRLTTLQLLFDAAGAQFEAAGLATRVQQLAFLTHNPAFGTHDGDLLKPHHQNDDKAPFSAVMEVPAPVEYADLPTGRTGDTLYHRNDDGSRSSRACPMQDHCGTPGGSTTARLGRRRPRMAHPATDGPFGDWPRGSPSNPSATRSSADIGQPDPIPHSRTQSPGHVSDGDRSDHQ